VRFYAVFEQILALFLLLLAGYLARKSGLLDSQLTKGLSGLLLKLALPALIIDSMQKPFSASLLRESGIIFFISLAVYACSVVFALLFPRVLAATPEERGVFSFALIFSNVGFMGYPVVFAVFGETGVFYAAIYNLPFNFLLFTLGIMIISKKVEGAPPINWKLLVNPAVAAVFIGFFLFLFSVALPRPISLAVHQLGLLTPPLSMLLVGSLLCTIPVKRVFTDWRVYIVSLLRLLLLPFLVWLALQGFRLPELLVGIPTVITAMPAAANSAILAEQYEGNAALASQIVFLSTLLSVLCIPLVMQLL
jgi:predicted permease